MYTGRGAQSVASTVAATAATTPTNTPLQKPPPRPPPCAKAGDAENSETPKMPTTTEREIMFMFILHPSLHPSRRYRRPNISIGGLNQSPARADEQSIDQH